MQLDLRLIVPDTTGGILLDADGGLPRLAAEGDEDEAAVIAVDQVLRGEWRLTAPILETHPRWHEAPEGGPIPTLVTTEPAPAGWQPPDGLAFARADDASAVATLPPALVPRAGELVDELRTGVEPPPLRPRWARRGWHARATAWMRDAAARAGRPLTGEPRPYYLRGISALLRAPTAAGDLYLKAVFPPFHAEPVITRFLAERYPECVPRVVDIDADEGWLLVEDVDGGFVETLPAAERAPAMELGARTVVGIQRSMTRRPAELAALAAAGAPHRPLEAIPDELDRAIGPDGLGVGSEVVTAERRAAAVDRTAEAVRRLADLRVPETIVHGDFHNGNVAVSAGRIVILDWSDAAIGSPLVDLVTWIAWAKAGGELEAATEAWLDAWSPDVNVAALRDRLDDVIVIGAAYQVISYDGICRGLEPATRYTMSGGGDNFLKRLEGRLAAGSIAG